MKGLEFPIVGTKVKGVTRKFDLADTKERKAYFEAKAGDEIKQVRRYLEKNTFVAYMVGKKNSGKGTYFNLFSQLFGTDRVAQVSVGDVVREIDAGWEEFEKTEDFAKLKRIYRGYMPFEEAVEALRGRSQSNLLPTEFILALLKLKIDKLKGKAIFLDGMPRDTDQVSYSLFFRDLADYRDDPDLFILIDIPMSVIDERIKYRVMCPRCRNSRNTKLLVTKDGRYDETKKVFYLMCDSEGCGTRMEPKEGDEVGIAPIKARLEKDEEVLKAVFGLHGIPKVLLRNHVPAAAAGKDFDDYELTPEYVLSRSGQKVEVGEKPWTIKDDSGVVSNSLLAPPVVVSMLKQLPEALGL